MLTAEKKWQDMTEHERDLVRLKNFTLMDDDFMSKCFEDNIECTELVLHIVLDKPDLRVHSVVSQYSVKNLQGRSVRLDVFATDSQGKKYNIEVQRDDRGADVRRARYNSSIIDANQLSAGEHFEQLPETYVIFITERDVLGWGLPLYSVSRVIEQNGKPFGDGSHIYYVNAECRSEDTPLGRLMSDFCCTEPNQMHYPALAQRTRYFKEEKGAVTMCKAMEEMRNEAFADGENQGKIQGKIQSAKILIQAGKLTVEEAKSLFGLTEEQLQAAEDELA